MPRLWRARLSADEAFDSLREGDLVFFSGTRLHERCMQFALGTPFQHMGIIVVLNHERCILESGSHGVIKCNLDLYLDIARWSSVVQRYGRLAIRRLLVNTVHGALNNEQRSALRLFATEMLGRQYAHPTSIVQSFLRIPQRENNDTVFCSELVAGAYKCMGFLPKKRAAADYLPCHFRTGPLVGGAALTSLTIIIFRSTAVTRAITSLGKDNVDDAMRMLYARRAIFLWLKREFERRRKKREAAEAALQVETPTLASQQTAMAQVTVTVVA